MGADAAGAQPRACRHGGGGDGSRQRRRQGPQESQQDTRPDARPEGRDKLRPYRGRRGERPVDLSPPEGSRRRHRAVDEPAGDAGQQHDQCPEDRQRHHPGAVAEGREAAADAAWPYPAGASRCRGSGQSRADGAGAAVEAEDGTADAACRHGACHRIAGECAGRLFVGNTRHRGRGRQCRDHRRRDGRHRCRGGQDRRLEDVRQRDVMFV